MLLIFRLQCKELTRFVPFLLIIVLLQCVMGQVSAVALGERSPVSYIGYYVERQTALSQQYINGLSGYSDISLLEVNNAADREELFNTGKVQAFFIVPDGFDASVQTGVSPAVILFKAPGIADMTLIKSRLTDQWLLLRTKALAAELYVSGAGNPADAAAENEPVLLLDYQGPLLQERIYITPPAFGIPALFLLLAFLHSAGFSAGGDNPRWKMKGDAVLGKGNLISMAAITVFWVCAVILYALSMKFIYQVTVPLPVVFALSGLAAYVIAAGGLLSFCAVRRYAVHLFIPLLLLNMTIGGGLWNAAGTDIMFPVLLPVSAVLASGSGSPAGAVILWAQAVFIFLLIYILSISSAKSYKTKIGGKKHVL